MDKVIKKFNQMLTISTIMVLFDLIVGVFLFFEASFVNKVNMVMIGCLLVVHGIFQFMRYFYEGTDFKFFFTNLITSIVSVVVGLFSIFNPVGTIKMVGVLFGIWMVIYGGERLYYGIRLMKSKDEIFPLILIISLLFILMGILIIFNPFASFMLITKLMGMFLIILSILDVMTYSLYKKRCKEILKLFQ